MISPVCHFGIRENEMAQRLIEKFVLRNELSESTRLGELLAAFTEKYDVPARLAFRIDLVLDELVTNIIKYGYKGAPASEEIHIELYDAGPGKLQIVIVDAGVPFNPLEAQAPDIDASIEDRPIGGLGIHFAKEFTEDMFYKRHNDKNYLTMIINFNEKLIQ